MGADVLIQVSALVVGWWLGCKYKARFLRHHRRGHNGHHA